jgi:hypothetical protein
MRRIAACLVVLAVAGIPEARGQAKAKKPTEVKPVVAEGASFAEPTGWFRLDSNQAKTKGWFLPPNSPPANPKRMIIVDIGKPTAPDARATAEGMAKDWGGVVVNEPTTLDGVPAFHVRVENRKQGMRPVEGIVVHRGGKAYMLMGGTIPGLSIAAEFEEVRKTWKWVETK